MANQSPFIALSKYLPYIEGISITAFVMGFLFKRMDWLVTMSNEQSRESLKPLLLRAVVLVMIGFYLLYKYGISTPMN